MTLNRRTFTPGDFLSARPTPKTPITAYAYCEDCGADAGTACVDENLLPCALCLGRTLATKASYKETYRRSKALKPATSSAKVGA